MKLCQLHTLDQCKTTMKQMGKSISGQQQQQTLFSLLYYYYLLTTLSLCIAFGLLFCRDVSGFDSISPQNNKILTMKNNRFSNPNKLPPRPTPVTGIGSLKAIMNQGRVPLNQYINQRPNKNAPLQSHQLSYFEKVKAKMHNGSRGQTLQKQINDGNRPRSSQKMDVESDKKKINSYLCQYQGTGKLSFKNRMEPEYLRGKERAKSMNKHLHNYPPTTKKITPPPDIPKLTKAVTHDYRPQTQGDSIQPTSQQKIFCRYGKQVKREKVDYRKFQILLQNDEEVRFLQLQDVLGCGANATVRSARTRNDQQFAVKIYEKYKLIEPKRMKRVMHQIDILGQLQHPNIIKLTHCFQDKRQIHLLFEFVVGAKTLQEYIRENGYSLPEYEKKQIAVKIAEAVSYLHQNGISHRDIKTDNVIIGKNGEVKVIDFGFATTLNKGESHCGTPNYMAPELFEKKNVYNPAKVDAWALGVLLFYLYEGTYPFKGYSEKQLCRNIAACNYSFGKCQGKARQAIERVLTGDPNDRSSVSQICSILKQ